MEQKQQVTITWCPPDLNYGDILTVDDAYVKRPLGTTQSIDLDQFDATLRLTTDTDDNPRIDIQS